MRTRAGRPVICSSGRGRLFDYHYGEGAYADTELAIQELLGIEREPLAPLRPEDAPGVVLSPQTADQPGAYNGPYEAGGVWGVFGGSGSVTVNGALIEIPAPGAHLLIEHPRHTAAVLELTPGEGLELPGHVLLPRRARRGLDRQGRTSATDARAAPATARV